MATEAPMNVETMDEGGWITPKSKKTVKNKPPVDPEEPEKDPTKEVPVFVDLDTVDLPFDKINLIPSQIDYALKTVDTSLHVSSPLRCYGVDNPRNKRLKHRLNFFGHKVKLDPGRHEWCGDPCKNPQPDMKKEDLTELILVKDVLLHGLDYLLSKPQSPQSPHILVVSGDKILALQESLSSYGITMYSAICRDSNPECIQDKNRTWYWSTMMDKGYCIQKEEDEEKK